MLTRKTMAWGCAGLTVASLLGVATTAAVLFLLSQISRPECDASPGMCGFGDFVLALLSGVAVFGGTVGAGVVWVVWKRMRPPGP